MNLELKSLKNKELDNLPIANNITQLYEPNNLPDDIKNLISYASKLGVLAKVKDAGLIDENKFNNIKKRISKSYKF